jgi:LuxR family transcriptional regulator, maltose regulon positive regulatory protein
VTYCWAMAEVASGGEQVREGEAALARGAWAEARAIFEEELEAGETLEALEGLSWAAWWTEDVPACLDARERAYRLGRQTGDRRRAAMMALWLGDDHLILRGERAVANGWFQRAARILEGLDPCPEHGWLAALQGYMALGEGDTARARELAARARELGRRLGVLCLEMFGLAVEGVALVNEGQVEAGMRCLDEATAAALGGEYEQIVPAGWTCCLLIGACERVRDYDRAAQWCRKVDEFSRRMRINFVTGTCRAHYGAVLTWHGNWPEAERELTEATEDLTANRPSWSGAALVRLADLRRRQGRLARRRSCSPKPRAMRSPRWAWPSWPSTKGMPRPLVTSSSRSFGVYPRRTGRCGRIPWSWWCARRSPRARSSRPHHTSLSCARSRPRWERSRYAPR